MKEFFLLNCKFFDSWSEGDLIEELIIINNHVSVCVAMHFFGISQLESKLPLMIGDEINLVITLFDRYCKSYTIIVGIDNDKRVFEKL